MRRSKETLQPTSKLPELRPGRLCVPATPPRPTANGEAIAAPGIATMPRDASPQEIVERIRRAVLSARIDAARIVMRAAENSGDWQAIEIAHGRLLRRQIEQWRRGWDD